MRVHRPRGGLPEGAGRGSAAPGRPGGGEQRQLPLLAGRRPRAGRDLQRRRGDRDRELPVLEVDAALVRGVGREGGHRQGRNERRGLPRALRPRRRGLPHHRRLRHRSAARARDPAGARRALARRARHRAGDMGIRGSSASAPSWSTATWKATACSRSRAGSSTRTWTGSTPACGPRPFAATARPTIGRKS